MIGHKSEAPPQALGTRLAEVIVFFAIVVLAFAVAILVILTDHVTGLDGTCYLSTSSVNVCRYGYAVCIISFLLSILTAFALCRPPFAIACLAAFGAVWWLAFAITTSAYNSAASDRGHPEGHYRGSVVGMAWASFVCELGIFALAAHLYRAGWQPIELGAAPEDEFDRYKQFKERQGAEKAAKAGLARPSLGRVSAVGLGRQSAGSLGRQSAIGLGPQSAVGIV